MQIGIYEPSKDWQKFEELMGESFISGKEYMFQSRGTGCVVFHESADKPDDLDYSGVILYPSQTLSYEKGSSTLWCKAIDSSKINVSTVGE